MPLFMYQVGYSPEGWQALIKNPQNRLEAVRPVVTKLGGRIEGAWMAFGKHDVVLIAEMPANVDAAALAIAVAGSGAMRSCRTTPLMSVEEGVEAMKRAGQAGYRAPR